MVRGTALAARAGVAVTGAAARVVGESVSAPTTATAVVVRGSMVAADATPDAVALSSIAAGPAMVGVATTAGFRGGIGMTVRWLFAA